MLRCRLVLCVLGLLIGPGLSLTATAADLVATTLQQAEADPDFKVQGEYEAPQLGVQVVARGEGDFMIVRWTGGLPGAGWNGKDRQVADGDAETVKSMIESLGLKKVDRKSPTLGAAAPAGAVVLFDGTAESLKAHWKSGKLEEAESLLVPAALTKEGFQDFTLHLEFRLPYMPRARGQGRGNSGLYVHGRYEVQMLDSFGLEGKNNECGGLYSQKAPDLNMCLPPLVWQTYDIDFTAPRFDGDGKKTTPARLTVRLNGVPVHQDVELKSVTPGQLLPDNDQPGPLFLQDHNDPVRFRNIWIQKKDARQEARRPILPAWERQYASAPTPSVDGGLLLVNELGCVNCHTSSHPDLKSGTSKSGPVLTGVGSRVRADWLTRFLMNPHEVKPGTTMPSLLDQIPPPERERAALALTRFLVDSMEPMERLIDRQSADRGNQLFHSIGCVACHAPRNDQAGQVNAATSVPLPLLGEKYSIPSLEAFLKSPATTRPSGRMPSLKLTDQESRDLACYLVGDVQRTPVPNVNYAVYHGDWTLPPDFTEMKPVSTGMTEGFDLSVAKREDHFGIRFEGYWNVEFEAPYTFYLKSDDGSRLFLDGELLTTYTGPFTKTPPRVITKGVHHIRVDYVEAWGEQHLSLEVTGRGIPRQSIEPLLRPTAEQAAGVMRGASPGASSEAAGNRDELVKQHLALKEEGRRLFDSLGCASCHTMQVGESPLTAVPSKGLDQLRTDQGCLSANRSGEKPVPQFDLTATQTASIVAAIEAVRTHQDSLRPLLTRVASSFNCTACHQREGLGGPERSREALFVTTQPEMGDEGRLPPPLNGVGDKLHPDWLNKVLRDGLKDRPYMQTRMPRFASLPASELTKTLARLDARTEVEPELKIDEAEHRRKAAGRRLVGNNAFGCVKCHTFGATPSTGIQALDLLTMTQRVRKDWFLRYLKAPQDYRPGTRMPTPFVNGQSVVPDLYHGDPLLQSEAVWTYLSDGAKAAIPDGLQAEAIELMVGKTPVIYRAFLAGLSPRGIAVGYPEKLGIAWDAERMSLNRVWKGRFLDASKHWIGRGAEPIHPLGDHVLDLEMTTPVAWLSSPEAEWPGGSPRETGYRFRGYRLDEQQRPVFRYELTPALPSAEGTGEGSQGFTLAIEDQPVPLVDAAHPEEPGLVRTLRIRAEGNVPQAPGAGKIVVRLARGTITALPSGEFQVGKDYRLRLRQGTAVLQPFGDQHELRVPVGLVNGQAEVVYQVLW